MAVLLGVISIIVGARQDTWAEPIIKREVIHRTDFISAGVGGLRSMPTNVPGGFFPGGSGTIILGGLTGVVNRAWLFWAGPADTCPPDANANLLVNSLPVRGENIGVTSDNCWGFLNSQAYRADVTEIVRGNLQRGHRTYVLSGPAQGATTNINPNGASLLVFYDDGKSENDRDIVYFYGNDSNFANHQPYCDYAEDPGWVVDLPAIHRSVGPASIELHVSDGQYGGKWHDGSNLVNGNEIAPVGDVFNGTNLPSIDNGPLNNGNLWDIVKVDVMDQLRETNSLRIENRPPQDTRPFDCVSLIVAVINLPAGAIPKNHPPVLSGTGVATNNGCGPMVLKASVSDLDGDALTTAASVDGTLVYTGVIPRGSPVTAGTITFTHAFAPGEHRIVFAVADGSQSASMEMVLHVIDLTPPVLRLPSGISRSADPGRSDAVVNFTATATDECDPGVTVLCEPPSGSLFPVGVTVVRCSATDRAGHTAQGSFTVTLQDNARLMKRQALASLEQLLPTITDRDQRRELREATNHLARSLTPAWWVDDFHLVRRKGEKVFHEEEETVDDLRDAIRHGLPASLVQGTINSLVAADRALAATGIAEADRPTCKKDYLAKARRYFAAGDARAAAYRPTHAIEEYEKAWKHALAANRD